MTAGKVRVRAKVMDRPTLLVKGDRESLRVSATVRRVLLNTQKEKQTSSQRQGKKKPGSNTRAKRFCEVKSGTNSSVRRRLVPWLRDSTAEHSKREANQLAKTRQKKARE
jgi:hypothetical protein